MLEGEDKVKNSYMKKMIRTGGICAAVILAIFLSGCGKGESTSGTENASPETTVGDIQAADSRESQMPIETPVPTATSTPTPTPTPTPDPVYVRPSYANVISGSSSYVDETGSFVAMENSLVVFLPTDDAGGYVWHCLENGGDGIFEITEEQVRKVPYTYTSGRYGGKKVLKSEIKVTKPEADDSSVTEPVISEAPAEDMIEENEPTEYDDIYVEEVPEEYAEEVPEEYVEEYTEEVPEEDVYYAEEEYPEGQIFADGLSPVSLRIDSSSERGTKRGGMTFLSSAQSNAGSESDYTYVYAPARSEYTFTAQSPGTSVYCLEYTKASAVVPELDGGFILYLYADEGLNVTFDLVRYSFAECVAAPDGVPEAEASVTEEEAAAQAEKTAETYDSCLRENNMIGAAAEMVEGAYWEAVVMDPSIAQLTGNGSAFYHEDYQDYTWDVFTINPVSPGRTTAYFVYRTGYDSAFPRSQVVDITVGADLSVTAHVRRLDLGVEFD